MQVRTLLQLDLKASKAWFSQHLISKIVVVTGFLGLFAGLFVGLFFLGLSFFYGLSSYQEYGVLTAQYIFNASLVVLFWLGLGSSLMSGLNWLLSHNPEMETFISLPLSPRLLVWHHQYKAIITTVLFLWLFISPLHLAYHHMFTQKLVWISQFELILVILTLVLIGHTLSTLVAAFAAKYLKDQGLVFILSSCVICISGGALALIKALFPTTLRQLYASQPAEFTQIFYQLPLNSQISPTHWLATSLTNGLNLVTLALFVCAVLICGGVLYWFSARFLQLYQTLQAHPQTKLPLIVHTHTIRYQSPLISNIWLGFARNAKELGYGVFLLLLASFFFFMLSQMQAVRQFESQWNNALFIFVLGWIIFFCLAYTLRMVFPLPSKLKPQAWLLLTSPITRTELVLSYLLVSFGLVMPLLVIVGLTWSILPFSLELRWFGTAVSFWSVLIISLLNLFLGMINPDFAHADDSDKVSTSTSGLLSVSLSSILGGVSLISIYLFLQGTLGLGSVLLFIGFFSVIPVLIVSLAGRFNVDRYQF